MTSLHIRCAEVEDDEDVLSCGAVVLLERHVLATRANHLEVQRHRIAELGRHLH